MLNIHSRFVWILVIASTALGAAPSGFAQNSPSRKKPLFTDQYQKKEKLSLNRPESSVIEGAEIQRDSKTGQVRRLRGHFANPNNKSSADSASYFLNEHTGHFGLSTNPAELKMVRQIASQGGVHITYQQQLAGLPVLRGSISVSLDRKGSVRLINNDLLSAQLPRTWIPPYDQTRATQMATALFPKNPPRRLPKVRAAVFVSGAQVLPIWQVELVNSSGDWEILVDTLHWTVASIRNQAQYANGRATVFNPDPVTTSGNINLVDLNGADSPELNAQLTPVVLQDLDGSGFLDGTYASTKPTLQTRAHEPTLNFSYTRSDLRFDEVMAYFHIDTLQHYIQSLGFMNINNRQIGLVVNGITDDNSHYDPSTKEITFGSGGVHDAQDAEIIYHEAGHAIQDSQVPGFGATEEGGAMGEGFGDYWAGSNFARGNAFDIFVGKWDAVAYNPAKGGNPAFLRRLDSTKHYPENLSNEVHADGEIWSACLWKIRGLIGRAHADRLILESHFHLSPSAVFQDGARAILQANQDLFAGAAQDAIKNVFVQRGILPL